MVRTVTPEDIPVLGGALARAFDDDPMGVFAHPVARTRPPRLAGWFAGRMRTLVGEELCFCDDARTGAALWAPPDRWEVPARELLRAMPRLLNHRTPQLVAGFRRVDALHPREPHFYLAVLGVEPRGQRRGLGSRLLAPMLERCDREGVGAYLESSKEANIAFYGRHGFRVTGEVRMPGGPPLWLMWRDPR
jgi:ribosomal protein S18 acetylase RimI-like enzyme